MLNRQILLLFLILGYTFSAYPQQSEAYISPYADYGYGLKLYKQEQYSAAQAVFERVIQQADEENLKANAAYYSAMTSVYLRQSDAEDRLKTFLRHYPNSPKRNSVFSKVADFYFQERDYKEAQKWYKRVNTGELPASQKSTYYFNNAYAAFKSKDTKTAKAYFKKVKDDRVYGDQAKYYLGFMAYEKDNYKEANTYFEEVDEDEKVNKHVSYFQSDMSFKSGNFEKAIEEGKKQLSRSNRQEQSELNKIIGESYFNLKEYQTAIPYLEEYKGKKGKWNNTDYYQLGYAYYKTGNFEKAVSQFNKIIGGKDDVAQNAYYHLAECYIHLDHKQQALNAFKNASEMDFDKKIKEDAALNYAKLSYDIGNNYKSVPEVLNDFLKAYPNSPEKGNIQELLINSYLTSKNYKKALDLMDKSADYRNKSVYQKVAFYRGLELYEDQDYKAAKELFQKSIAQHEDAKYEARATYWLAETDYINEDYHNALIGYKSFAGMSAASQTPEYQNIDYNIGYAYFNQQQYKSSKQHFTNYLSGENLNAKQKNDAYLRLGDSYFALSDYWTAMENYNKAIAQKNIDSDYAYYQKAISYGFVGKNNRKIEDLNAFLKRYPKSLYRDDALYQLGNTYVAENQTQNALEAYQKIVKNHPKSHYASRAMLKQGLIYYNNDDNQKALAQFKKVATQFPKSDEAHQAVQSAKNIYVDLGQVDQYAAWTKSLGYVEVSDEELDNATYDAAENKMLDNNNKAAIAGFDNYIDKFPNGIHAVSANYHLAQLLYKQEDFQKAKSHYQFVIDQSHTEYTERSLERLSRIYLEEKNYQKVIPVLMELEKEASLQSNITFAQSNLMKAYYEEKDYQNTVDYAEKVLQDEKSGSQAKNDAHIFIARSAIKTGDEEKAKRAYTEVAKEARGKLAAEAKYYEAYFKRKAGDYKASNEVVQDLARDYSGYKEFSVKGLLLMGKNFYDLDDAYQATYILQNIIDNFQDYPEVVEKAKAEQARIKSEESKTNSSIDTLK